MRITEHTFVDAIHCQWSHIINTGIQKPKVIVVVLANSSRGFFFQVVSVKAT